ncbi:MAG: undecaprenyl-diphosphate phosphatase [Burkholderiaceae bacterium]|nr:undecaprenyl-diphosphate phosphatase [Burkholderiaceae bacterium]
MELLLVLKILLMGVVEGVTEFLPISSTGHLILAGSLLHFTGEKVKVFEIAIQSGAMLSVCCVYRGRIGRVCRGFLFDARERRFACNVALAFLPAAVLGVLFSGKIKAFLFSPVPVATAFIAGGLLIIWIERATGKSSTGRVEQLDDMNSISALKVGFAQALALIPGTSRSGATIMGGLLFGLSRRVATEFSFFLAIPTLFGASVYAIWKEWHLFSSADIPMFALGSVFAFLSAWLCVRWLLRYIESHSFVFFAWYRIAFGIFILVSAHLGWVGWAG